jgi:hypothetical protein
MCRNIKHSFNRRDAEAGCFILLSSQPHSRGTSGTTNDNLTTELAQNNHYILCTGNYTSSLKIVVVDTASFNFLNAYRISTYYKTPQFVLLSEISSKMELNIFIPLALIGSSFRIQQFSLSVDPVRSVTCLQNKFKPHDSYYLPTFTVDCELKCLGSENWRRFTCSSQPYDTRP